MDATRASADKIQADQLASVSTTVLRLRPKLLLPVGPVLMLLLIGAGAPPAQLVAIAANFLVMLAFFFWEAHQMRTRSIDPQAFARSLMITLVGIASVCSLSGGPRSPFLPILFAPTGIAFAAFGSSRSTRCVLIVLALSVTMIGASPWLFEWPAIRPPHVHLMLLLATLVATTLLYFGVTGLASAYRETAARLERLRLDVIESTARKASELEALGARMAHELKNPLASIKGLAQLMHDGVTRQPSDTEPALDVARLQVRLGVVLNEVSRVEAVLEDSLTLTRPLLELCKKQQRLDAYLFDFAELIGGQAQQTGVVIQVECPESYAEFDPDKLKQALLNLAQNSLYAMPGGGTLGLRGTVRSSNIVIEVSDDGPGMSDDDLARIKEPYFSRRPGGTGLGVAIANGIVEQHGGTLSFDSTVGGGTTARLSLPLGRSQRAPALEKGPA